MEWAMSVVAIEAEAVAQALCMETRNFVRAYRAFADKRKPVFEGSLNLPGHSFFHSERG